MIPLTTPPAMITPISEFMRGYDHAASLEPERRYRKYRDVWRHLMTFDDFCRGAAALTTGDHEGARP